MNIYQATWTTREDEWPIGDEPREVTRYHETFITCRDEFYAQKVIQLAHPHASNLHIQFMSVA